MPHPQYDWFSTILPQLVAGAKIQRHSWIRVIPAVPPSDANPQGVPAIDYSRWIQITETLNGLTMGAPIMQRQPDGTLLPWMISHSDILAGDWHVVAP